MNTFRRFIVFAYGQYYPRGGMADVVASFDSFEEAKSYAKTLNEDYVEILDCLIGEIV